MKACVLHAEWAPRKGAKVLPEDEARQWAVYANQCFRNPSLSYEVVPDPGEPAADELLIKIGACGICGSDEHMLETDDEGYMLLPYHLKTPVVIGHEMAGKVVAVGKRVKEFKVDDLVTVEEIQWCGECTPCRGGYWNVCERIEDFGFTIDGGFAEYVRAKVKYCWSLNDVLERYGDEKTALEVGSMSEPCSVAYEGMFTRSGGFRPGSYVAVFGAGPIGLASIALAKAGGASKIFAFEVVPERLAIAEKLGATHVANPTKVDVEALVAEETHGQGVSMAVEASGNFPAVMRTIENVLGVGGKIDIVGMDGRPVEMNFIDHQLKDASTYGSVGHSGSWDFPMVNRLMASGQIDMHHAITRRYALPDLVEAIEETKTRKDGKILVKPEL